MRSDLELHELNPLHLPTGSQTTWTSVNTAETMPGVMSPLGWSFFLEFGERGTRGSFADLGVLSAAEVTIPAHPDDRVSSIFFGRFVANVDTFRAFADRIPGSAGEDFEAQIFGSARPGAGRPTRRRWPAIFATAPVAVVRLPARMERLSTDVHRWWRTAVTSPPGDGRAQLRLAAQTTEEAMRVHVLATFVSQGLFSALEELAATAGLPGAHLELSTGYGEMEETDMVHRLWRVAHQGDALEDFLSIYGFHGPEEGEISVRSWREQPALVEALVAAYRRSPDQVDPRAKEGTQALKREKAEQEVLARLGDAGRARARFLFRLARRYIPLRETGKAALHKGFDGARAAARSRGAELVADSAIDTVDDVFYLTYEELMTALPDDVAGVIAHRKELREAYRLVDVPRHWVGEPEPVRAVPDDGDRVDELRGTGASHGVAEGTVRVCHSADECDALEFGDVLVCRATNPGWASAFPLVSALVIDIGSPGSHAAIIAREMGLPCVIGTDRGTALLRQGDRVRVDGNAGVVTILEHAAPAVADALTADPPITEPAADRPAADDELVVLRALQLKGRVEATALAEVLALDASAVEGVLEAAAEAGELKVARKQARLTPAGRERVAQLLAGARAHADEDRLEALYERFHEPNDAMKELMTRWQLRDGEPNDHRDEDYDGVIAAELAAFHSEVSELADDLAAASPLLASYPRRLAAAAAKVAAGDRSFIAAPLADSYHTAWFELHDDLILLLGRTREDEAAAGRAV